ncbi:dolichyl-phosphate-mannose-protein mannosyltransferase [Paenibacillus taihuensis]|uniref:Dolichyl-phosphate-mannose-protein mannosyltransferase n=1 Tax=Paenibacillus taihuensis TaxID=1156355 RepID=A0A3D9SCY2_9BACL|nr:glycosyltransferase family 39 protein [Paenibacillus taihuensis]REE91452.1 dolichyl-phosphate-mannose-protein mannosyltransferase [Paenibacillus taihuensis]
MRRREGDQLRGERGGYRNVLKSVAAPASIVVGVLLWVLFSLMHRSPYAGSWDEVDFVLALDRFDLLAMQPHFPGYPYFVMGAMAVRRFVHDPVLAYDTLNIGLLALSVIPLWLLARRVLSPLWSVLAVLLVLTAPYLWLQAVRPMSEAAGIAMMWWFLWSWWRAMERRTWGRSAAAMFSFSLMMGIRLSFVAFGVGLLWLLALHAVDWHRQGKRVLPRLGLYVLLAASFELLWVAGLALSEGGLSGFIQLALAFTEGHFSDWGGGVASAAHVSFAARVLRFAGDNVLWTGMFVRSTALLAAAAALLFAAVLSAGAARPPRVGARTRAPLAPRAAAWLCRPALPGALAALASAYGAWALLAQNIDKPRHITPLIGVMWLLLAMCCAAAPTAAASQPERGARIRRAVQAAAALCAACVIALQAAAGSALVERQAVETPAVYQLDQGLRQLAASHTDRRFVVYTWEEMRVLQYLHCPVTNRRIETYSYFLADVQADQGAEILLTDHVLQGFEAQVGPLRDKVEPLAVYRSDPLFEPVYNAITLYKWIG